MVVQQQDSIHRGNLLKLSDFLCSFSSDYDIKNGPITPDDIENALEFAHRRTQHKILEEVYYHWKRDWHDDEEKLAANQQKKWSKMLRESKASLDSISNRAKQTYAILQRFEVWSIQLLAKKYLLPVRNLDGIDAGTVYPACWSSLLNIPGACHFGKILPTLPLSAEDSNDERSTIDGGPTGASNGNAGQPDDGKGSNLQEHIDPCSLALPPNILTSREYLRLVRMLSILPDDLSRLQAANSPLTWVQKEGAGLTDYKFTAPDLQALWIRAQRNNSALRHLWQIFSFSEKAERRSLTIRGTSGSGKRLVPVQAAEQNEEENKPRKFVAKLIGNSRRTRARIMTESSLVDDLVTWAVINEVMCTFHHVRAMVKTRLTLRKRRLTGLYQNSNKRRRVERKDDEVDALLRACQSYVLRWFARRHLDTLAVLFLSDSASLARNDVLVNKMCNAGIPEAIHAKVAAEHQSFSQIDNNIASGQYKTFQQFYDVVNILLQAMKSTVTPDLLAIETMQNVITDFNEMYESFLQEGDPADCARLLLDMTAVSSNQSLSALLRSLPAPWPDKCPQCSCILQTSDAVMCWCCGETYHSSCCEKRGAARGRAINLIRKSWTFHVPHTLLPGPDFRENVTWTTVNITLERKPSDDGTLPRLGLGLAHTEDCIDYYDKLLSGEVELSKLEAHKNLKPLCIEQKGCLVTEVSTDPKCCSKEAGIRVGDVIVGVEFRSFLDPGVETKYLPRRLHSFAKVSQSERLELLRRPATDMRVLIERPSVDILQQSIAFIEKVRKANEPMTQALAFANSTTWLCRECVGRKQTDEYGSLPAIVREALLARSLLRCIGADYYAIPFHDEDVGKDPEVHHQNRRLKTAIVDSLHVSLRRLDGMMTSIISRHSKAPGSDDVALSTPFTRPAWSSNQKDCRLEWATKELELKPLELLCLGIRLLVTTTLGDLDESQIEKKRILARNFVVLFSSWCISLPGETLGTNLGPPQGAFCARVPWIRDCCNICQVRSGDIAGETGDDIPFRVCESQTCRAALDVELGRRYPDNRLSESRNSGLPIASTDLSLLVYEECSSYVGATVLILPSDPIVLLVQQKLGFNIEHNGRVVEFVVASYVPDNLDKQDGDNQKDTIISADEGTFHLLPVLSQHQLQYLLKLCKMRKPSREQEDIGTDWLALDILKLDGVLRLTPKELRRRLSETSSISAAIDGALEQTATFGINVTTVTRDDADGFDGDTSLSYEMAPAGLVSECLETRETANLAVKENILRCIQQFAKQDSLLADKQSVSNFFSDIIEMLTPFLGRCGRNEDLDDWHVSDSLDAFGDSGGFRTANQTSDETLMSQRVAETSQVDSSSACIVKYSDLYFRTPEEKATMKEALKGQQPKKPQPMLVAFQSLSMSDSTWFTVVLDREEASKGTDEKRYTGPGWGLELLSWPRVDSNIRVGRVHPVSPAAAAGLHMHDVVVSINGWDVRGHHDSVAGAMINLVDNHNKTLTVDELSDLFKNPRNAPLTPVVLVVCRPPTENLHSPKIRLPTPNERHVAPRATERASRHSLLSPPNAATTLAEPQERHKITQLAVPTSHSNTENVCSHHSRAIALPASAEKSTVTRAAEPMCRTTMGINELEEPRTILRVTDPISQLRASSARTRQALVAAGLATLPFRLDARGVHSLASLTPRDSAESGVVTFNTYRGNNNNSTNPNSNRPSGSGQVHRMQHPTRVENLPISTEGHSAGGNGGNRTGANPSAPVESPCQESDDATAAWNEAWNACSVVLLRIYAIVKSSYQSSRLLSARDLYRVGIPKAIFTTPETSVLIESAHRGMPMVGLGLLSLRYDVSIINWQLNRLLGRDLSSIPRLPEGLWDFLLRRDHERKQSSGSTLPIDRMAETFLRVPISQSETANSQRIMNLPPSGYNQENTSRLHHGSHPEPRLGNDATNLSERFSPNASSNSIPAGKETLQNYTTFGRSVQSRETGGNFTDTGTSETDLARIRGGGPDQVTQIPQQKGEGRRLCENPCSEWPKSLVSGVCDFADDATNQTAKFIGFVIDRSPDEEGRPADLVRVSVFYLSWGDNNSTYIEDEEQVVSASMLHLVEEGSDEANIAQTWWAVQTPSDAGPVHDPASLISPPEIDLPLRNASDIHVDPESNSVTAIYAHNSDEAEVCTLPDAEASPPTPELKGFEESDAVAHDSDVRLADDPNIHTRSPIEAILDGAPSLDGKLVHSSHAEKMQGIVYTLDDQETIKGRELDLSRSPVDNQESLQRATSVLSTRDTGEIEIVEGKGSHHSRTEVALTALEQINDDSPLNFDTPHVNSLLPQARVSDEAGNVSTKPQTSTNGRKQSPEADSRTGLDVEAARRSVFESLEATANGSLSPLGELPDGREVFWLRNDPGRLYYEDTSNDFLLCFHEKNFRRDLNEDSAATGNSPQPRLPEVGKFCCLWGCRKIEDSTCKIRPTLCFDTLADLGAHIKQCHTFTNDAEKFSFDVKQCLSRIPEGDVVLRLIVDLTEAICSRFPSLLTFTEVFSPPQELEGSLARRDHSSVRGSPLLFRINDVWEHANGVGRLSGSVEIIIKRLHHGGKRLRALLSLWVKAFLLTSNHTKLECDATEAGDPTSMTRSDSSQPCECCDSDLWPSRSPKLCFWCQTCSAPSGRFQSWKLQPALGRKSFQGAGCALLSDLYRSELEPVPFSSLRDSAGLLGVAQALLIRAANNLPEAVKKVEDDLSGVGKPGGKQFLIFPLWNESNFEVWRDFVSGCSGSRGLAQGFLVLVSSIKKSLLPSWWASSGTGWLSAQSLMFKPSLSKVILHLIVFDAAVAEFVLTASTSEENDNSDDNVPACLAPLPLEERMSVVAKWADELNVKRFEGMYTNFCCKCDDGGDLLCCEYCAAVQHPGCCSPPLPSDPPVFVCSVCIADIAALHESAR